ncbi:DUF4231 domain-containing protein [Agaribacterium haliotis]|uniref:DUF4231 domain-containing protein n=1 Tax=Agaribacterium haliotis TaxID=2013869 RepID=UPI000BB59D98|nr:DUF4231 domain-containing protein [Agaribacterium haliotis]
MEELIRQIDSHIDAFNKKIKRDKDKAYRFKLISLVLTAVATIALGLEGLEDSAAVLKNTALVCTAGIAFFNGIDMYYNHKGLWIQYTVSRNKLYELKDDIALDLACAEQELDEQAIRRYYAAMKQVIAQCNNWWEKERRRERA